MHLLLLFLVEMQFSELSVSRVFSNASMTSQFSHVSFADQSAMRSVLSQHKGLPVSSSTGSSVAAMSAIFFQRILEMEQDIAGKLLFEESTFDMVCSSSKTQ